MTMKKQWVSVLLLCAVLLGGCGTASGKTETAGESASDTTPTTDTTPVETEVALFPKLTDTAQKADYDGYEFHILTRGWAPVKDEMGVDALTGETINDAVFNRNLTVGERYNMTISRYYTDTTNGHGPDNVKNMVLAGDSSADMVVGSLYGLMPLTTDRIFYDLQTLPDLDLSMPCWSQGLRETATVAGRLYAATGSIALTYFKRNYAIFFNKKLSEQFGIQANDVYAKVLDGTWTMDEMFHLTKDIYKDVDGDGEADDSDIYGIGIWLNCMNDGWWSACDIPILRHDENDLLYLDVDIDKLGTVVDKLNSYIWNNPGVCPMTEDVIFSREISVDNTNNVNIFYDDQICFTTMRIEFTEREKMRNMDDYGVLPYPKYDGVQESYYGFVHDAVSMVMIPQSCTDAEMVARVMQSLAVEGHNSIMPQYYEVVLTTKYIRDEESVEMLDILFQNTKFDSGWVFCNAMNALPQKLLREQVWQNQNTLSSMYQSLQKSIQKSLETINKAYSEE